MNSSQNFLDRILPGEKIIYSAKKTKEEILQKLSDDLLYEETFGFYRYLKSVS